MTDIEWKIPVGSAEASALYQPAESGRDRAVFVCAHGAGGNMIDRGMIATAAAMRANGIGVVRFNFVYKEKKSGRPDPMPVLMGTVAAVVAHVRTALAPERMVIGGRSMGGRAASMLAADGCDADGLLLLAYPLHPAGQPEKLRVAHLPRIGVPVLFFSGTRDALCTPVLMKEAVNTMTAPVDLQWVEGADHSFHVLKSSGTTDSAVLAEIGRHSGQWVETLG